MPFVKKQFHIASPKKAFLFIMHIFGFTQGQAQRLIAKGRLLVNNRSQFDSGATIQGNVQVVYFQPSPKGIRPLFQSLDFMIFEKPSGVLVHPNTISTPYSMLDEIRAISGDNANATHRIDMETSGLLLASKHKRAEAFLKNAFEIKTVQKSYLAWVDGEVKYPFTVNKRISLNNDYSDNKHKVFISNDGKKSFTEFFPIKYDSGLDATLLSCHPTTGRTHQIRLHLFHVKHPILGDPLYGSTFQTSDNYLNGTISVRDRLVKTGAKRLMLHADSLKFSYNGIYFIKSKQNFAQQSKLICAKEFRVFNQ